jgi:site-specific recombinase XerD
MARKLNRASASPDQEALASSEIYHCYQDFILARKAMLVSDRTLVFYNTTAGEFVRWLVERGKLKPGSVTARDVRTYLNEYIQAGAKASYVNGHARAIRTLLRFFHEEKYIREPVKFKMPPSGVNERLPYLTAEQVRLVVQVCTLPRDKALLLLMVDCGARRSEIVALNWEDVDIKTGVVTIKRGKGGKSRSVVIGARTRRALLAYRRTIEAGPNSPLFQTVHGERLTINGLRSLLLRISKRAGIHITPHTLRRTFATLSLRAGMSPLHLQGLLGHSTLEMTRRYTQMIEDDLVQAHREHGPIDNFIK